jgi:threonine 3-dehydrogenase
MKALYKKEAKPGIWMKTDAPIPAIGPNDVLIKIKKTAICGTDIHIFKWDEWSQKNVPVGLITGHEYVGVIEKVGSEVKGFKPGDRVSGEGHITCGHCRNCRSGKQHLCIEQKGIGVNRQGAFAEYLSLPSSNVVKIPDEISDDIAAFFDPFGNATHTALSFDLVGEDVLITGAGPIGAMAASICRFAGARHVVITDVNEYRLGLAEKMGATRTVNVKKETLREVMSDLKMTEGFDVGLEMSGSPDAFRQMIDVMRPAGKIALLGIPPGEMSIDWSSVIFKGLTLKGIYGREMFETWHKMISMVQSGLDLTPMVTHRFPVDDFQQAFDTMASGHSGKVILEWES